jgi:hypothetical protein
MLRVEQNQRQAAKLSGGAILGAIGTKARNFIMRLDQPRSPERIFYYLLLVGGNCPPELAIPTVNGHGPKYYCAGCYGMKTLRHD